MSFENHVARGVTLHPAQAAPANTILQAILAKQSEVVLTGPAGTGKTTLMAWLFLELKQRGIEVNIAAPTNKAAKVLHDKGLVATTIHKKFFVLEGVVKDKTKPKTKTMHFTDCRQWKKANPDKELPAGKLQFSDVIVVDEASMIPFWIAMALKRMCKTLVLVGDNAQLAPVGDRRMPRGYFNTCAPTAELTTVLRQGADSPILKAAQGIRDGSIPSYSRDLSAQFHPRNTCPASLRDTIEFYDSMGISWRIVVGTNATRYALHHTIRGYYGYGECFSPHPGELMIAGSAFNDDILNGTEIEVLDTDFPEIDELKELAALYCKVPPGEMFKPSETYGKPELLKFTYPLVTCVTVGGPVTNHIAVPINLVEYVKNYFPDMIPGLLPALRIISASFGQAEENDTEGVILDYAYAVTVHKAQGSEYDHVFVVDERDVFYWMSQKEAEKSDADDPLLGEEARQRWIYTACTRSKHSLTIIPRDLLKKGG